MAVGFSGNWADTTQQAAAPQQTETHQEQTTTAVDDTTTTTQEAPIEQTSTEVTQQQNATETTTDLPSDEVILKYFQAKGREVTAIEELFKAPEKVVEKVEVDPYSDILPENVLQYLKYAKDTNGRSYEDFMELNKDYDKSSPLELAIGRAKQESGMNLSREHAIAYLEKKLNVDLSDADNIDPADDVELNVYATPYKNERKAEKEKYLQPIERQALPGVKIEDYEKLEDGSFIPKSLIAQHQENQRLQKEQYLQANTKSVDAVTESVFKVDVEENGTKKEMVLGYEFSDDDRRAMLSTTNDVSAHIEKTYRDENGGFKNTEFNENHGFWANKALREKAISSIVHKALAKQLEDIHKRDNNVNFTRGSMTNENKNSAVAAPFERRGVGFGANFLPNK